MSPKNIRRGQCFQGIHWSKELTHPKGGLLIRSKLGLQTGKRYNKSSLEVVRLTKVWVVQENAEIVSFDIKALLQNIPIGETLNLLEEWLNAHMNAAEWRSKLKLYKKLTTLCMNKSHFRFGEQFYLAHTDGKLTLNPPLRNHHGQLELKERVTVPTFGWGLWKMWAR